MNARDILDQADRDGVAVVSVSDGTVFTFTADMLRDLLEQSEETGRVVVFVKHQVMQ